jgi:hypothetical protein
MSHHIGLLVVLIGAALFLAVAGNAFACSTGAPSSIDDIARTATLIAVADVVSIGPQGLNDRIRIIRVIHGNARPGEVMTIGPGSVPPEPSSFPDCWLSLPASTRVLVALSGDRNLDALTSWAWWEENGALVTASAVEPTSGNLADLVGRFERAASLPETDAPGAKPTPTPAGAVPEWLAMSVALGSVVAVLAMSRRHRLANGARPMADD